MSITINPYADEDAASNDDVIDASSVGDAEPPVLKAFSHIGKTFRQGGFCTPSPKRKREKKESVTQDNDGKCDEDMAKPLQVENEKATAKDEEIMGKTPPIYVLLVFICCVVSSLMFCYKPDISIAFERKVDDIMTSTQLYSFESSLMVAFLVLFITKIAMSSENMKTKTIQYVWTGFVCAFVGLVVFFLTKTKSENISPTPISSTTTTSSSNNLEKKGVFQHIFRMKKTT